MSTSIHFMERIARGDLMEGRFNLGDIVKHRISGEVGVVTRVYPNQIELGVALGFGREQFVDNVSIYEVTMVKDTEEGLIEGTGEAKVPQGLIHKEYPQVKSMNEIMHGGHYWFDISAGNRTKWTCIAGSVVLESNVKGGLIFGPIPRPLIEKERFSE